MSSSMAPPNLFPDVQANSEPETRHELKDDLNKNQKPDASLPNGNLPTVHQSLPGQPSRPECHDLALQIPGMYRTLDLISEQGSGGMVDKVIIDQEGLKNLVNDLSPGAYTTVTKVDFKALDKLPIRPLGIYGDKGEIAKFLASLGFIDDKTLTLLANIKDGSKPSLRSGIYLIRRPNASSDILYAVYWPQDQTWQDNAPSGPIRNRITFMRYLTKIADQIVCLMSSQQSHSFVWDHQEEIKEDIDGMDDEDDRLFSFEITKRNEQDESVVSRPGFSVTSELLRQPAIADDVMQLDSGSPQATLSPRLLPGEVTQGFLTLQLIPPRLEEKLIDEVFIPMRLAQLLSATSLKISCELSDDDVLALVENGLGNRHPKLCGDWRAEKDRISKEFEKLRKEHITALRAVLDEEEKAVARELYGLLVRTVIEKYPTLDPVILSGSEQLTHDDLSQLHGDLTEFCQSYGQSSLDELRKFEKVLSAVGSDDYESKKKRLVCVQIIREDHPDQHKDKLVDIIENGIPKKIGQEKVSLLNRLGSFIGLTQSDVDKFYSTLSRRCRTYRDAEFLAGLDDLLKMVPETETLVKEAIAGASGFYKKEISKAFAALFSHVKTARLQTRRKPVDEQVDVQKAEAQKRSRDLLFAQIETESQLGSSCTVILKEFKPSGVRHYATAYKITAIEQRYLPSVYEYQIHKLEIPSDHHHNLQLDTKFIPTPTVNQKDSVSFELPLTCNILHAQLLAENRILLVIEDQHQIMIYLESISFIRNAVVHQRKKRTIHKDKFGKDVLIAYDESKRLLAFCAFHKLILHIFAFDETFGNLQSWGQSFELASWYNSGTFINHITFIAGTEDLLLVDSIAQARIFSLVTQRFRPASVSLPHVPTFVLSSPDGACALFIHQLHTERSLAAYHWDTFGATEGITIPLHAHDGSVVVTSFVNRKSVHLMILDEEQGICNSIALDITKKSSEFMFQEKGTKVTENLSRSGQYINNCLMDCFADVWTRFPVAAAVTRQSIILSTTSQPKRVTFVTDHAEHKFTSYFSDMVKTFVDKTKKPTGGQLEATVVDAQPFHDLLRNEAYTRLDTVSEFRAGEWLMNLLCLIPIHIAVARENRFIPLKDGVTSAEFERSLLGAEVGRIVDSLSFGWYESILRSYMADKPVRVVSSMGEQSVGKSFSLNHLMDTSFAGSAMRTTEGVWMSVTPTDEALLVALDFEGVHSIERSPQEDALLVLFNTAISNLVLFRNNFAISRDIADLFQSFQASSAILDPDANPSLFQSTLVIIIKDVVESDKREIVREFSLKFQKIVEEEQAANFITRLHAGRLNIIPWPVIESHQFYNLFSTLKRRLDSQKITHPSAGEFLFTLKILMAKLKANDWGAMSQSLASHRVQTLLAMLPTALEYGMAEIHPDNEPLKNLDNDSVIHSSDTLYRFFISHPSAAIDREHVLMQLQWTWDKFNARNTMIEEDWIHDLAEYLENLARLRLSHVDDWISINLRRFKSSGPSVEMLQRQLANDTVELQANVELCKMTCAKCHLSCILSRRHDPTHRPHDCTTNHQCLHSCDFGNDHPAESRACGFPAGHNGPHICTVEEHLCGEPCLYKDKKGCQGDCTQTVGHAGEHMCAARKHVCGKPCELQIKSINYGCPGTCDYPSDEDHEHHICDNRMCPISCQLCKRLCGNHDHLHGLNPSAMHLCGEAHACTALCNADGICQIDTAPHSIEATFTGRHETFQYTKYTQVAKRLNCVKAIPAGQLDHDGKHVHSTDTTVFHYCETKCPSCGYYCTLPRGHPQQEHDTSHGSMSSTRWVIDGRDNTAMELDGRRFGANDDGAPMMCNMVCQSMGRHVHIDYCRTDADQPCRGTDYEHINTRLSPNPNQPKDWTTHALFWRRSDPYSREDQANFAKCDSMCSGPEHAASASQTAQPSYCTLPMFHPPHANNRAAGLGYVSNDGHLFSCKNPAVLQQAFHVIFVIDRSGSMSSSNSAPLPLTPVRNLIVARHNNRLGAVYSALHGFWHDRHVALNAPTTNSSSPVRRDSYSVILFESHITRCVENDFQRTPNDLLNALMQYGATGGTNYEAAIQETESVMRRHWNTERTPIVIFLSDGECSIRDETMRTLCRAAIALGKPLSFHSVSFGPHNHILRRMAQIAREVEATAPRDPLLPAAAHVASSYAEALDSVRLAETFLGIAESLRKTRGSLMA